MSQESVQCMDCEVFNLDASAYDKVRQPCPECGSIKRAIGVSIGDQITWYECFRVRQAPGPNRTHFYEQIGGDELMRSTGKFIKKIRIIDQKNDWYYEVIVDPETQTILRECAEPLSLHHNVKVKGHDFCENQIAVVAYDLWEQASQPHGRDQEHWFAAIEHLKQARKGSK